MVWVHADASSKRLDEKYLVGKRVQMPLPHLAQLLSEVMTQLVFAARLPTCLYLFGRSLSARLPTRAAIVQKMAGKQPGQQAQQHRQLLDALNDIAHHEIDEWLRQEQQLSEPFVARTISEELPSGMPCLSAVQQNLLLLLGQSWVCVLELTFAVRHRTHQNC